MEANKYIQILSQPNNENKYYQIKQKQEKHNKNYDFINIIYICL